MAPAPAPAPARNLPKILMPPIAAAAVACGVPPIRGFLTDVLIGDLDDMARAWEHGGELRKSLLNGSPGVALRDMPSTAFRYPRTTRHKCDGRTTDLALQRPFSLRHES